MVVAQAAMSTGVATRPITDFEAHRHSLDSIVYRSGMVMGPALLRQKHAVKNCFCRRGRGAGSARCPGYG